MSARRGDPAYWHSSEEAFLAGREQGFDRGYEEGAAAVTAPDSKTSSPVARAAGDRRVLELGVLLALALGAWRLLRTWPGRLIAVGSLFAFSGLVSIGMVVLALVVGAFVLAWAVKTAEQVSRDTRAGVRTLRAGVRTLRAIATRARR